MDSNEKLALWEKLSRIDRRVSAIGYVVMYASSMGAAWLVWQQVQATWGWGPTAAGAISGVTAVFIGWYINRELGE